MTLTRNQRRALVAGLVVAAIAIFLALFDWNWLRGPIGRIVSDRTGREFAIDGNLDVDLGFTPRVTAERVRFGNAPWAREPRMFEAARVDFRVRLWPLFSGNVEIPEATLSQPMLALERAADGRRNWILKRDEKPDDSAPIVVGALTLDRGTLVWRDAPLRSEIVSRISMDAVTQGDKPVSFSAEGRYKGLPLTAKGHGGSVFRLRDETRPFPLDVSGRIGSTSIAADGTITGLARLARVDVDLDVRGDSFADLHEITGLTLPSTPPYRMSGHVVHEGKLVRVRGLKGRVGDSDLGGEIAVDRSGKRPRLTGDLVSAKLDFDDLGTLVGGTPDTGETASAQQKAQARRQEARGRALPDKPFALDQLKRMDADVQFTGRRIIRGKALPLDDLKMRVRLDDGRLRLDPLDFGVAGGNIVSTIALDSNRSPAAVQAQIRFRNMKLNRLFPTVELTKTSVGTLGGSAKLAATGNSVAKLAASADGELALAIAGGRISNLLIEIAGIDGGEIIKFLFGGDRDTRLRCAVADFAVKDGVMSSRTLVLDTVDTVVNGKGTISFVDESMHLRLEPLPKDRSILSLRSPLNIGGTFRDPAFSPDKGTMIARGGAALLLATLVNPLVALIPLIETGPGEDADCRALLASARSGGPSRK